MKLEAIVFIFFALFNCFHVSYFQTTSDDFPLIQQKLATKLLTGYNSDLRPDDQISGYYIVILEQVIDINEATQVMTSSINIYSYWNGN
jgi:hypothetical protein